MASYFFDISYLCFYSVLIIHHTCLYVFVCVTGSWWTGGSRRLPKYLLGSTETHPAENTGWQTDASLCSPHLTWSHQSSQPAGKQEVDFSSCVILNVNKTEIDVKNFTLFVFLITNYLVLLFLFLHLLSANSESAIPSPAASFYSHHLPLCQWRVNQFKYRYSRPKQQICSFLLSW